MGRVIQQAIEGEIEYQLIDKGDDIEIIVKNNKTNITKTNIYECNYRPIFGYDVLDINNVNILLDEMINELK